MQQIDDSFKKISHLFSPHNEEEPDGMRDVTQINIDQRAEEEFNNIMSDINQQTTQNPHSDSDVRPLQFQTTPQGIVNNVRTESNTPLISFTPNPRQNMN